MGFGFNHVITRLKHKHLHGTHLQQCVLTKTIIKVKGTITTTTTTTTTPFIVNGTIHTSEHSHSVTSWYNNAQSIVKVVLKQLLKYASKIDVV